MSEIVLGVGDVGVARNPGEVLKTFALGSCVAVVLLDPSQRSVGMVHVALPDSSNNPARAGSHPGYFADTAVPALMQRMVEHGTRPGDTGLIVKLAGGAKVLDVGTKFDIGGRNQAAVRASLESLGLRPRAEDLGGSISRTVEVDVDRGRTIVSSARSEAWEL